MQVWLSSNLTTSLPWLVDTDRIKEGTISSGSFYVKPSLFSFLGKEGKAVAIDQRRNLFVIQISCPELNKYDSGFNFFVSKFKISPNFRIETYTMQFGTLRLLVEQIDMSDNQFRILIKTEGICFAFAFDVKFHDLIGDVKTTYINPKYFKKLDPETVLCLSEAGGHQDYNPEDIARIKAGEAFRKKQAKKIRGK